MGRVRSTASPWQFRNTLNPKVARSSAENALYCLVVAVVRAAVGAAEPQRVNRGKNGVTSNGILSRAEAMATGAAFNISAVSSQGLTFTRPPNGNAAI